MSHARWLAYQSFDFRTVDDQVSILSGNLAIQSTACRQALKELSEAEERINSLENELNAANEILRNRTLPHSVAKAVRENAHHNALIFFSALVVIVKAAKEQVDSGAIEPTQGEIFASVAHKLAQSRGFMEKIEVC